MPQPATTIPDQAMQHPPIAAGASQVDSAAPPLLDLHRWLTGEAIRSGDADLATCQVGVVTARVLILGQWVSQTAALVASMESAGV